LFCTFHTLHNSTVGTDLTTARPRSYSLAPVESPAPRGVLGAGADVGVGAASTVARTSSAVSAYPAPQNSHVICHRGEQGNRTSIRYVITATEAEGVAADVICITFKDRHNYRKVTNRVGTMWDKL
jgi:hypothetical protein